MLRRLRGSMPFPPPPARAPGVPAARPSPRRPGAPRKAAAPARAPPAAREKLRPEASPSRSWPSATLPRPPARRAPGPAPAHAPAPPDPGRSPVRTAGTVGTVGPAAAARSSPRLPPEAARPAQRRHPERQLLARPRRPPLSPAADARAQVAGPRGGGDPGGLGARRPVAPLLPRGPHTPRRPDLRRALPGSLLSARHRDHDVEAAEEEAAAPDEGLVRRCTAWLQGVEAAAAARALDALPHLSAL
ncbi:proline-rich protein 18 isoform X1 [Myotis daubentonii]|uniref:proline-rich protein 18 isoform X1 n=2 Tax=Myotis daubentonii TaxID=98922 RepID=UPI002873F0DB|nr:proline-rich protein 18 isoform X1 [Myotis daubentonii]XP_059555853.1 proline-rich protein 18 isoform X1 [Myotis daubentonii]